MACLSLSCAWFSALKFFLRKLGELAVCLALLTQLAAMAQDSGTGSQTDTTSSTQESAIQRVEIVARQGSTELRRAASVAKQI